MIGQNNEHLDKPVPTCKFLLAIQMARVRAKDGLCVHFTVVIVDRGDGGSTLKVQYALTEVLTAEVEPAW